MSATFGSQWRRWDLHVHSPASYGGEFSSFIQAASNADAEVIGINDYFTLRGYHEITQSGGVPGKVIFPVVEFRMNNILENKAQKKVRINFHIIFNNDPSRFDEIQTWLNSLDCMIERGQSKKLGSIPEAERREKVSVDFFKVVDDLKKHSSLRRDALVWVPYDEYGGIDEVDPENDEYFKSGIISRADFLGSSNKKQIQFFLHESKRHSSNKIREWLGNRALACLKGSDAHAISYPIGKLQDKESQPCDKYCWVKSDCTFEGLRQVLYEPQYRLHIGAEPPQQPLRSLSKVVFDFPDDTTTGDDKFCFAGRHEMVFSPNLTCLVGGRGTGKSTALSLIYERLHPGTRGSDILQNLQIGEGKAITDCIQIADEEQHDYVEFLAQNEIEEFALDQEKFTNAIYLRISRLDQSGKLDALSKELQAEVTKVEGQIQRIIRMAELVRLLAEKRKDLKANENIVASIKSTDYQTLSAKMDESTRKLKRIVASRTQFENLQSELERLLAGYKKYADNSLNAYEAAFNSLVDAVERLTKSLPDFGDITGDEAQLRQDLKTGKEELLDFLKSRNLSQEDVNDISGASERIAELEEEIKSLTTEVEKLQSEIDAHEISDLLSAKAKYEEELETQLKPVSDELGKLKGEVKPIQLQYEFDQERAKTELLTEFQAMFKKIRVDHLEEYLFRANPFETTDQEAFLSAIKGSGGKLNKTQEALVGLLSDTTNFRVFQLLAQKIASESNRFKLIRVSYDSKPLDVCSFGQRCTAAIVILLLLGNTPIIIDEPEAHLDGALIANYLVETIKRRKQSRQIIFATHNANFVVNGDSELINILEISPDGVSVVTPTTIENLEHRSHLLALEGGEEAFERRGDKYNVEHRLRV